MSYTRRTVISALPCAATAFGAQDAAGHSTSLDSERFRAAVLAGDLAIMKQMLDRDPALRYSRDASGVSVYTLACLSGRTAAAEELIRRGLILDILEAAASGNVPRATEIAKQNSGIAFERSADGRTPMHFAAAGGRYEMVVFLMMRGADLSAGPESPLLAALDQPNVSAAQEMSQLLLMNASDPNARRKDGTTALHLAAARGYGDIARMLIHRGASLDAKDAKGRTPADVANGAALPVLRSAASIERAHYGRRFTQDQHGGAVTREDTYGLPVSLIDEFSSVAHFDFDRVKQLHKLCPSLAFTRSTWDELGIEAAAHMGLAPMARFLADEGAPVSTCTATLLGLSDLVKQLIAADRDCVRERGAHDIALLAYAAYGEQREEIAGLLLASGADVQARALGMTTLHIAATKGYVELAEVLLSHGADVNAVAQSRGETVTPLGVAMRSKRDEMAQFLRDHGGRA